MRNWHLEKSKPYGRNLEDLERYAKDKGGFMNKFNKYNIYCVLTSEEDSDYHKRYWIDPKIHVAYIIRETEKTITVHYDTQTRKFRKSNGKAYGGKNLNAQIFQG